MFRFGYGIAKQPTSLFVQGILDSEADQLFDELEHHWRELRLNVLAWMRFDDDGGCQVWWQPVYVTLLEHEENENHP